MRRRLRDYEILYEGQRVAKGSHECGDCCREICPGETYYTKVVLIYCEVERRRIEQVKSCCRNR